jgi:MinD superfamily P-loop ATPase
MIMQIAVASGKGGTGKTTLATNLAHVASGTGRRVAYLDCDVEEPNGHIFLPPQNAVVHPIEKLVPTVDLQRCTACGQCGEICQYHAIVCVGKSVMVFPELCHSCGGCSLVCPAGAIDELPQPIGQLRTGTHGDIAFVDGTLDIGQHMGPPAIRAVKAAAPAADMVIIDAPPGSSCPMVEAVRGSDLVILVTEPTPFGLYDLQLAVETVRALQLPVAVVVNRADLDAQAVRSRCRQMRVPILGELPEDRAVAEAYSSGRLACAAVPGYRQRIESILEEILNAPVAEQVGRIGNPSHDRISATSG